MLPGGDERYAYALDLTPVFSRFFDDADIFDKHVLTATELSILAFGS